MGYLFYRVLFMFSAAYAIVASWPLDPLLSARLRFPLLSSSVRAARRGWCSCLHRTRLLHHCLAVFRYGSEGLVQLHVISAVPVPIGHSDSISIWRHLSRCNARVGDCICGRWRWRWWWRQVISIDLCSFAQCLLKIRRCQSDFFKSSLQCRRALINICRRCRWFAILVIVDLILG